MKLINLLPKARQQELFYEQIFHRLLTVMWLTLASFLLVLGVQLAVKIYLQEGSSKVAAEADILRQQVSKSENEQIKKTIAGINGYIGDFKNLSTVPKWSKVLSAFAALPPEEVSIKSLTFDFKTKAVQIQGYAPTREKVIELYNNILNDPGEFYNVDYPLENVAKPTDNNFHFTFFIKDELLK